MTIDVVRDDLLDDEPPDIDVILVGDAWYEEQFAGRISAWLRRAADRGIEVLIGDPGRRYLDHEGLTEACDLRRSLDHGSRGPGSENGVRLRAGGQPDLAGV